MKKIFLLLCVLFSLQSQAWDVVGHRIVADIAYHNLTPEAKQAVDKVLGYERALVATSSWADDIKSDVIYPGQDKWHFQDLDAGKSDKDIEYLFNVNKLAEGYHLFQAKDSIVSLLKREPANADALKFLVHLSGDEFQPMHMGHHDDLGGNKAKFYWFGRSANLHSLWDTYMIEYTHYSSTEFCDYLLCRFAAQRDEMMNMDELSCIKRTYKNSNEIYKYYNELCKGITPDDRGARRFAYGFEYKFAYRFRVMLDEQLYLGGIQLAKLLNEIYK